MSEKVFQKILKKLDILIELFILKTTLKSRQEIAKHKRFIKKVELLKKKESEGFCKAE